MRWFQDEWDEAFNEIIHTFNPYAELSEDDEHEDEEEKHDEREMYFDVPLPYRPL